MFLNNEKRKFSFVMQVYIEAKSINNAECFAVRPDDRLGLFLEEAPAAVAYTFDPNVDEVLGMFTTLCK